MSSHPTPEPTPAPAPAVEAPRRERPILATAAILALAAGAVLAARPFVAGGERSAEPPPPPLPVLNEVPPFRFAERNGGVVTRDDLAGKIWVMDFVFTNCAGICPEMSMRMAGVHNLLRKDPDALCLSVTVDPERDTPEVLREYAGRYGASDDRWLFLRGTPEEVHALAYEGFRIGDEKDLLVHSRRFVLVDRDLRVRGYYDGTDAKDISRLLADYRRLRDGDRP